MPSNLNNHNMGRPKGSKNKVKQPVIAQPEPVKSAKPVKSVLTAYPAEKVSSGHRGRPPGAKNKNLAAVAQPKAAAVLPVEKKKGRPPKVKEEVTPPSPPSPPPAIKPPEVITTVVRTDSAEEDTTGVKGKEATYTLAELQSPLLDEMEEHVAYLVDLASPARKVYFEGLAIAGVSYMRRIMKTFIDFLEIDLQAYLENQAKNHES